MCDLAAGIVSVTAFVPPTPRVMSVIREKEGGCFEGEKRVFPN